MIPSDVPRSPASSRDMPADPARLAIPALSHRRLSTPEEIAAERSVWEQWVIDRYHANPFLALDWHLLWLKHFAPPSVEIHYYKVMEHDRPIAYFPLILERDSFHGFKVRILRYAGNIYSPINCPILVGANATPAFDYLVERILPGIDWQVFQGVDLPPEYPGTSELQQALLRGGYPTSLEENEGNWICEDTGPTPEAFHANLGFGLRRDTRRFARKFEEMGQFRFRLASLDLLPKDISDYRQVYARSWKEPEFDPTFHPELMEVMSRRGALRLGTLCLDDRPIAAQLWLHSAGRGYVVKTAHDEEFVRWAPGSVLTWKIIEELMRTDGMVFFDYLKGDDDYKKRWAPVRRHRCRLVAFNRTFVGRALHALDRRLLPWIRRNKGLNACKHMVATGLARLSGRKSGTGG